MGVRACGMCGRVSARVPVILLGEPATALARATGWTLLAGLLVRPTLLPFSPLLVTGFLLWTLRRGLWPLESNQESNHIGYNVLPLDGHLHDLALK